MLKIESVNLSVNPLLRDVKARRCTTGNKQEAKQLHSTEEQNLVVSFFNADHAFCSWKHVYTAIAVTATGTTIKCNGSAKLFVTLSHTLY